jgi:hypothetical protein
LPQQNTHQTSSQLYPWITQKTWFSLKQIQFATKRNPKNNKIIITLIRSIQIIRNQFQLTQFRYNSCTPNHKNHKIYSTQIIKTSIFPKLNHLNNKLIPDPNINQIKIEYRIIKNKTTHHQQNIKRQNWRDREREIKPEGMA